MTAMEIVLQEGMRFLASGQDGVTVSVDTDEMHGGMNAGFRPMELLLAGLGSCTGMDVLAILRKKRQQVAAYRIEVLGKQADEIPHIFTAITIRHILYGDNLSEEAVRRSIALSETKYCPAFAMLARAASITSSYELHPATPAD